VSDLVTRLTDAAAAAIADLGPILEHDLPKVRGVALELTLANGGSVVGCTVWLERRANIRICRAIGMKAYSEDLRERVIGVVEAGRRETEGAPWPN